MLRDEGTDKFSFNKAWYLYRERRIVMVKEFAVVGGDLRTIKLAKILAKEGNMVYTYGLEKAEELKEIKNIIFTLLLHLP